MGGISKAVEPQVFLGGTCAGNNWRQSFIDDLVKRGIPAASMFNPVVADWTPAHAALEHEVKRKARFSLFYIANPMDGNPESISAYSVCEAIMGLYDRPAFTLVVFDAEGMSGHTAKQIAQIEKDLRSRFPRGFIMTPNEAKDFLIEKLRDSQLQGSVAGV